MARRVVFWEEETAGITRIGFVVRFQVLSDLRRLFFAQEAGDDDCPVSFENFLDIVGCRVSGLERPLEQAWVPLT